LADRSPRLGSSFASLRFRPRRHAIGVGAGALERTTLIGEVNKAQHDNQRADQKAPSETAVARGGGPLVRAFPSTNEAPFGVALHFSLTKLRHQPPPRRCGGVASMENQRKAG
jgi:hypothetical protein